jgi:GT2 family glycosyltransferase
LSELNYLPLSPETALGGGQPSLGAQGVLYHNDLESIDRALAAMGRAAEIAIAEGVCSSVSVHYGDSSARPCISEEELRRLRAFHGRHLRIEYQFFNANLGSAGGHNQISQSNPADFLLLMNPDVILSPRALEIMLGEFTTPGVGIVEAKQLPIEHPKDYDIKTGETSWGSGACTMIPARLFRQVGGYDSDSFFLYCDDVDLSWRVRLTGFKIIFQPAAVGFHDKRLSVDASWQPTEAEKYYSAEAALLLAYKWSRADLTERHLEDFARVGDEHLLRASAEFERRKVERILPTPLDPDHRVAQFIVGNYAKHRFSL